MKTDIGTLETRKAPIDLAQGDFRAIGHQLVDVLADWLGTMPSGPITRGESPAEIRRVLRSECGLPDSGTDPSELLVDTAKLLFEHSLFNSHPRFFGYV